MITAAARRGYSGWAMINQAAADTDVTARKARALDATLRTALRLVALTSTLLLALALTGHVVRDRTWWLALLMYVPLTLVAPFVIVAHLAAFERRAWKRRVLVIAVSAVALVFALHDLRGDGPLASPTGSMRVLQWNVQWGRDEAGWTETVAQIEKAAPDIIILSEAPSDAKLAALCARLGREWTFTSSRNAPRARYWYSMAILSRWAMSEPQAEPLPNGAAYAVTVPTPRRPTRVVAVDGMSNPKIPGRK